MAASSDDDALISVAYLDASFVHMLMSSLRGVRYAHSSVVPPFGGTRRNQIGGWIKMKEGVEAIVEISKTANRWYQACR